jgi:hypothetical protein
MLVLIFTSQIETGLNVRIIWEILDSIIQSVARSVSLSVRDGSWHNIHHCTPWHKTLLETESGKSCGRYYKQPAIHLSGLRDCKTLLMLPLG